MDSQTLISGVLQTEISTFTSLRRIVVIGREFLLKQGVACLLDYVEGLEVFRIDEFDPHNLVQIQPDVIILCEMEPIKQISLAAFAECLPSLANLRIIVMDLESMEFNVFQHDHWFSAPHTAFFPLVYGENIAAIQQVG